MKSLIIGERSEPPSDKLGGENCISSHVPVCLSLYIKCMSDLTTNTMPNTGGNFHLKVGGGKSSGNAGDPMLGVAVIP